MIWLIHKQKENVAHDPSESTCDKDHYVYRTIRLLKKQLSIYYFPSSFYQEKVDKKLRLIGGYTYLIAVLAVFTFPQPYSRRFAIAIIIISIIPRLYELYTLQLQKNKLSRYQNEVDKKEYFITQGTIQKIQQWNKTLKQLKLEISFQTLDGSSLIRVFNIPYPQFDTIKATYDPEKLIGQTVELYLLPQSYLLLQIQIIPTDIHQLQFVNQQVDLWSLHQQGILTNQVCIAPTIHSLQFIRAEQGAHFSIYCYCSEYPNFEITSAIANFEDVERTLFESFDDLDFNHYQKLKYSNNIQNTLLYQVPNTLTNKIKKQRKSEIEIHTSVCFVIFMILFFIGLFYLPMIWAIVGLLSGISLIIAVYFYYMLKYSEYILPTKL